MLRHAKEVLIAVVAGTASLAGCAAAAQELAPATAGPLDVSASGGSCRVVTSSANKANDGGAGMLMAVCGGRGVPLGRVTRYNVVARPAAAGMLVVLERGARKQVLLVTPIAAGSGLQVDDLTRELSQLGGRAPELGLGDMAVDVGRFAAEGIVGVRGRSETKRLDVTRRLARAATISTSAAAGTVPAGTETASEAAHK